MIVISKCFIIPDVCFMENEGEYVVKYIISFEKCKTVFYNYNQYIVLQNVL